MSSGKRAHHGQSSGQWPWKWQRSTSARWRRDKKSRLCSPTEATAQPPSKSKTTFTLRGEGLRFQHPVEQNTQEISPWQGWEEQLPFTRIGPPTCWPCSAQGDALPLGFLLGAERMGASAPTAFPSLPKGPASVWLRGLQAGSSGGSWGRGNGEGSG